MTPTTVAASAPLPVIPPTPLPPAPLLDRFDPTPITAAEATALHALMASVPPARDDVRLAQEYARFDGTLAAEMTPQALTVGAESAFNVIDYVHNVVVPIEATLLAIGDHGYFWFDVAGRQPTTAELAQITVAFDEIYERDVAVFGQERTPGIDNDARLHIVHASPAALCGTSGRCGLGGMFVGRDGLPRAVNPHSNERDMFIINSDILANPAYYLSVLAHEFRHMIEDNYDPADVDWEVEGSAMLAQELAGHPGSVYRRGNDFLANPDQQLNRWTDGNTGPYYGMGYVLNRYIYDRLGPDLYREFATNPLDGLDAITAVAAANGLDLTGERLWQDWLAALALHRRPQRPEIYRLGEGQLDTVAMTPLTALSSQRAEMVHQYGADYYHLTGAGPVTLSFAGSRRVPLLGVPAASGDHFWYANRANYSHPQLALAIDLSGQESATLEYKVYHDIEHGYDFAYLSVSTDGGQTWQGLEAQQMQGLVETDDPGEEALTDRFYTGQSGGWLQETVDLAPYTGQEIMLRFSYVTDPILTYGGFAVDDISIPELGFYDGAETESALLQPDGFTRTTAALPQTWHLQLVTFPDGAPSVVTLPVDEAGAVTETVELDTGGGEAILIVSASAPYTLEEAAYRLDID